MDGKQVHGKMLKITSHWEMQIKSQRQIKLDSY